MNPPSCPRAAWKDFPGHARPLFFAAFSLGTVLPSSAARKNNNPFHVEVSLHLIPILCLFIDD